MIAALSSVLLAPLIFGKSCESLKSISLPETTITSAELVPAATALPAHCRVKMVLSPAADSHINVEVWMPAENWNGKFMGVGNGTWGGSIQGYAEMQNNLRLGYATAGTDTGHTGGSNDGSFAIGHPEELIDYAYRAIHEMTAKSKLLLKAFYDEPLKYSYFKGCSTGGRQALMEAQRYPLDYDAIIAGAPSNRQIHIGVAALERSIRLVRNPDQQITQAKATLIQQTVMNTCDALKEGFLNNPRQCNIDFSKLLCAPGSDTSTCLTETELKTVESYYGGLRNSKGELVLAGQTLGNPIGPQLNTQTPSPSDSVKMAFQNPNYDWHEFDLDRDLKVIDEKVGFVDSNDPDLTSFKANGGKLLLYQGWRDMTVTPEGTISYYDAVLSKAGPDQNNWIRLFMAPGMGHCVNGPGVNSIDTIGPLEKWREEGIAPDRLTGRNNTTGLTRPLCPYPQYAYYKGSGDLKDASSFSCKTP